MREEGVNFYQNIVRTDIFKHFEAEQRAKKPLYPARGKMTDTSESTLMCKEQAVCAAVEDGGRLAW